jgi:hypothetical protein
LRDGMGGVRMMEQVTIRKHVLKQGAGDYLIYNFKGGKVDFTENPAKASHYDSYNQAEEIRQELEKAYPNSHSLFNLPIRINYTVG